jgi:deoxyribodipyrimidine photo-lyase
MSQPIAIHWFRRDLRLSDNAALWKALKSGLPVKCIFIFDKHILDKLSDKKDKRVAFIHEALSNVKKALEDAGSSLTTYYGEPLEIWKKITEEHQVSMVFANRDYEPYALERDKQVYDFLQSKNIEFKAAKDHVIFEKNEVLKDDGKPYTVFTPYSRKWKLRITPYFLKAYPNEAYLNKLLPMKEGYLHTLEEMGFEAVSCPSAVPTINETIIAKYAETRDIPSIVGTTRLSVHLRFGTVSIRTLANVAYKYNEKWLNELIWRDFYQMILWHFPHSAKDSFKPQYDRIAWLNNEEHFNAWCKGKTGYPIVDAGMRELNETGFMHNRVRMVVASFLTKHLLIDWRWGEKYFASKLLDFDLASNVGGWQWAASSGCDAAPYFRIFNPESQTSKFDPELKYIKKWVPELGTSSYPKPIVDHATARNRCLETFKTALGS